MYFKYCKVFSFRSRSFLRRRRWTRRNVRQRCLSFMKRRFYFYPQRHPWRSYNKQIIAESELDFLNELNHLTDREKEMLFNFERFHLDRHESEDSDEDFEFGKRNLEVKELDADGIEFVPVKKTQTQESEEVDRPFTVEELENLYNVDECELSKAKKNKQDKNSHYFSELHKFDSDYFTGSFDDDDDESTTEDDI